MRERVERMEREEKVRCAGAPSLPGTRKRRRAGRRRRSQRGSWKLKGTFDFIFYILD